MTKLIEAFGEAAYHLGTLEGHDIEEEIEEARTEYDLAKQALIDRCREVHDKGNKSRLRENARRNNTIWSL